MFQVGDKITPKHQVEYRVIGIWEDDEWGDRMIIRPVSYTGSPRVVFCEDFEKVKEGDGLQG